jgi:hypothetical protein
MLFYLKSQVNDADVNVWVVKMIMSHDESSLASKF